MSWEYGLKKSFRDGEDWYELTEIYGQGEDCGYIEGTIAICGESVIEIQKQLQIIIKDLENPNIVEDVQCSTM